MSRRAICAGCAKERQMHSLGLCRSCRHKPAVVARCGVSGHHEPATMEEIEAIIAEQRKHLPKWFRLSEELQDEHGPKTAGIRLVKRRPRRKELTG